MSSMGKIKDNSKDLLVVESSGDSESSSVVDVGRCRGGVRKPGDHIRSDSHASAERVWSGVGWGLSHVDQE